MANRVKLVLIAAITSTVAFLATSGPWHPFVVPLQAASNDDWAPVTQARAVTNSELARAPSTPPPSGTTVDGGSRASPHGPTSSLRVSPITNCVPGSASTPLAQHAAASNMAQRYMDACKAHCRSVDPAKLPWDVSNGPWQPWFCHADPTRRADAWVSAATRAARSPRAPSRSRDDAEDVPAGGPLRRAITSNQRFDNGCYNGSGTATGMAADSAEPPRLTAVFCLLGQRLYGPGGQDYVWESIRQFRRFHPAPSASDATQQQRGHVVYAIVHDDHLKDPAVLRNATAWGVTLVASSGLLATDEAWQRYRKVFYIQGYMHPGGSRKTGNKHFNQFVSERFFALHALMRRYNLRDVLHSENDVMLYADHQPIVDAALHSCGWRLASIAPHVKGFIPGILIARDAASLSPLIEFINDLLSCGEGFGSAIQKGYANDMTYLMNYYQLLGGGWLGSLPNALDDSVVASDAAAAANCVSRQLVDWARESHGPSFDLKGLALGTAATVNGPAREGPIEDGASFGQWYSFAIAAAPPPLPTRPVDPAASTAPDGSSAWTFKNPEVDAQFTLHAAHTAPGAPITTAQPPTHIRNAMKGRFVDATPGPLVVWARDSAERRVPVWNGRRLLSLHIHAKNLQWFRS